MAGGGIKESARASLWTCAADSIVAADGILILFVIAK